MSKKQYILRSHHCWSRFPYCSFEAVNANLHVAVPIVANKRINPGRCLDAHGQIASAPQSAHHIGEVPHDSLQQVISGSSRMLRKLINFPVPLQGPKLHSMHKTCQGGWKQSGPRARGWPSDRHGSRQAAVVGTHLQLCEVNPASHIEPPCTAVASVLAQVLQANTGRDRARQRRVDRSCSPLESLELLWCSNSAFTHLILIIAVPVWVHGAPCLGRCHRLGLCRGTLTADIAAPESRGRVAGSSQQPGTAASLKLIPRRSLTSVRPQKRYIE
jgi:hypothetical protein